METHRSSKHRVAIKGGIVATLCAIVWPMGAQSPHNNVRSPEPRLQKLILRAAARSASFYDLFRRLKPHNGLTDCWEDASGAFW